MISEWLKKERDIVPVDGYCYIDCKCPEHAQIYRKGFEKACELILAEAKDTVDWGVDLDHQYEFNDKCRALKERLWGLAPQDIPSDGINDYTKLHKTSKDCINEQVDSSGGTVNDKQCNHTTRDRFIQGDRYSERCFDCGITLDGHTHKEEE